MTSQNEGPLEKSNGVLKRMSLEEKDTQKRRTSRHVEKKAIHNESQARL